MSSVNIKLLGQQIWIVTYSEGTMTLIVIGNTYYKNLWRLIIVHLLLDAMKSITLKT